MEEAKVIVFTAYKRPDGFEISITFRGDDITNVMGLMSDALESIKEKGGTPVSKSFAKPSFPAREVKPIVGHCEKHDADMKANKNGTPYHTKGKYPDLVYCNGKGFPDEWAKKEEEVDDINF